MISRQDITGLSGIANLGELKQYHHIPEFKIGGTYKFGDPSEYEFGAQDGVTLESLGAEPLRTAYIAVGSPRLDGTGKINNAVIVNSYYAGDSSICYYYWYEGQDGNYFALGPVVGPGRLIDTHKYYVIFLDALGLWGASKPSDGLGMRFPQYSVFDCVQANYRLLKDKLNISRIKLVTGYSMGGIQTYAWALLHPEFIQAIMPIGGCSSTRTDPVLRWNFSLMTAAMKSDPVWRETNGDYYHLLPDKRPDMGMMFGWSILMHNGLDLDFRIDQGWDEVKREVFDWDLGENQGVPLKLKARDYDVNDLLVRNNAQDMFDVDDHLPSITCPTLVIHVVNDLWMRQRVAERSARRIPGARFASFESHWAHYALPRAPNVLARDVSAFLGEIR